MKKLIRLKAIRLFMAFLLVFSLSTTAFAALTSADKSLSSAQQTAISAATTAWNAAAATGNTAGMAAAHAAAEAVRNSAGYSSNDYGNYSGTYSGATTYSSATNSTASTSTQYNAEADATRANGSYGTTNHTVQDQQNIAGLTNNDTLTVAYLTQLYNDAKATGNTAVMNAAHTAAEALRGEYGYSGGYDGGSYISGSTNTSAGGSIDIGTTTYFTITAAGGTGGSISPSDAVAVKQGASQTYTITANTGYNISSVLVDGVSVGAVSTYTFDNVSAAHTISATFASAATLSAGSVTLGDGGSGTLSAIAGGYKTKSGYGFTANASVSSQYVSDITVTASYKFIKAGTTSLQLVGGTWQFPVNSSSATKARRVYVPVETKDGTYTITFTVKALDPQATALAGSNVYLTATKTVTLVIKGSMYEDDFTGDS